MKYNQYQLTDFLQDDSFVAWTLQQGDYPHWQQFIDRYPDKRTLVVEAQALIQAIYKAEQEQAPALNKKRIWQSILDKTTPERSQLVDRSARRKERLSVLQGVGFLILAVMGGLIFWSISDRQKTITYADLVNTANQNGQYIEEVNTGDSVKSIKLEDGTTVSLAKGSRLSFPQHFATNKREVVISGEAFFDVSKDHDRPFYVYANELVTKVLGTSFSVSALDKEKQIMVEVKTGKVSVFKQNRIDFYDPETQGLVILPNQKAVLNRDSEGLNRKLVDEPLPVTSEKKALRIKFEDASAVAVLNELERIYEVEIRFNEELLSGCMLSTTLTGESLYSQLDIICQTLGASYKVIDAQIIIESTGCK